MVRELSELINEQLQAWQQDPVTAMNQSLPRYNDQGTAVPGATLFDQAAIESQEYITARDPFRQRILHVEALAPERAAFLSNDDPEDLVDQFKYAGLQLMHDKGLLEATLPTSPWSDDYWAIYTGILGKRYADPNFPTSDDWKANFDYIQQNPATTIFSSNNTAAIDLLSPSEKYDALIGDTNTTLTRRMWSEGKAYYDRYGKVEGWMGICHGWAPAAYMLPRPTRTVRVPAANGTPITFYPSDLKALASWLWAQSRTSTRFIGGRCNDKTPRTDPNNGRMLSASCFDTNPGTWHLSVVNQIGAAQRSLVMDATYDYEVWNQPVKAYKYRYFNPQKMAYAESLAEATVPMTAFSNDRFRSFRSTKARSVVGIAMSVTYVVETRPTHNTEDHPRNDAVQTVIYYYDLELDSVGRIIGGEWYTNKHPDFLWTPPVGVKAHTSFENNAVGAWELNQRLPSSWQEAAQRAAHTETLPLAAIVERLIQFANRTTA